MQQAETLQSLMSIISRNAEHLKSLKAEKKVIAEQEKDLLENDSNYQSAVSTAESYVQEIKEKRAVVRNSDVSLGLRIKKKEITQQEKEIKETLSNHLTNYYSLTNSRTFDLKDGGQIDFNIRAGFGSKQLSLF